MTPGTITRANNENILAMLPVVKTSMAKRISLAWGPVRNATGIGQSARRLSMWYPPSFENEPVVSSLVAVEIMGLVAKRLTENLCARVSGTIKGYQSLGTTQGQDPRKHPPKSRRTDSKFPVRGILKSSFHLAFGNLPFLHTGNRSMTTIRRDKRFRRVIKTPSPSLRPRRPKMSTPPLMPLSRRNRPGRGCHLRTAQRYTCGHAS